MPDMKHASVLDHRRSGILVHVGSLPDPQRRGVLGEAAHRFVDLIADSGFNVWQLLPVGPEGDDDSPYFSSSAHAGNPRYIDRAALEAKDWTQGELDSFVDSQGF